MLDDDTGGLWQGRAQAQRAVGVVEIIKAEGLALHGFRNLSLRHSFFDIESAMLMRVFSIGEHGALVQAQFDAVGKGGLGLT